MVVLGFGTVLKKTLTPKIRLDQSCLQKPGWGTKSIALSKPAGSVAKKFLAAGLEGRKKAGTKSRYHCCGKSIPSKNRAGHIETCDRWAKAKSRKRCWACSPYFASVKLKDHGIAQCYCANSAAWTRLQVETSTHDNIATKSVKVVVVNQLTSGDIRIFISNATEAIWLKENK